MDLRLHNSLTRRVEPFVPLDPSRVTMYVCGPTVYNYVHIGNARPPVVFGVLAALLRRRFPQVVYARNITDVDDKINAAARERGVPIGDITAKYAGQPNVREWIVANTPPAWDPATAFFFPSLSGRSWDSGRHSTPARRSAPSAFPPGACPASCGLR